MRPYNCNGWYLQNPHKLAEYYRQLDQNQLPIVRGHQRTRTDEFRAAIIRRLMCNFRCDLAQVAKKYGEASSSVANWHENLSPFAQDGLVELDGEVITVTELGRHFVRNIAMNFDSYLTDENRQQFSSTV